MSPLSFAASTSAPASSNAARPSVDRSGSLRSKRCCLSSSSHALTSTSPDAIRRRTSTMCPRPAASMKASARSARVLATPNRGAARGRRRGARARARPRSARCAAAVSPVRRALGFASRRALGTFVSNRNARAILHFAERRADERKFSASHEPCFRLVYWRRLTRAYHVDSHRSARAASRAFSALVGVVNRLM